MIKQRFSLKKNIEIDLKNKFEFQKTVTKCFTKGTRNNYPDRQKKIQQETSSSFRHPQNCRKK